MNIQKEFNGEFIDSFETSVDDIIHQANQYLSENNQAKAEKAYVKAIEKASNTRLISFTASNYQHIINCLQQLGFITVSKIQKLPNNIDESDRYCCEIGHRCLRAIILYNAALTIHKKLNLNESQQSQLLKHAIKEAEIIFLNRVLNKSLGISEWQIENEYYKQWKRIRVVAGIDLEKVDKIELKSVDDHSAFNKRAQMIRNINIEIANGIKILVGKMIERRIGELEALELKKPCDFSLISFGSLAKESATPYSDFEFGILLEKGKDSDVNKRYFQILSFLFAFNVVNLGQTAIPMDFFKEIEPSALIDLDQIIKPGFQFDLGGKTPLGRLDKAYDLIQTPDNMVKYLNDETDKLLPIELMSFNYLYGSEQIINQYKNKVEEFLNVNLPSGLKYCEDRAVQILLEGREDALSDLEKYSVHLEGEDGKPFQLKQEIYRLPDRLLEGLGLFFGEIIAPNYLKLKNLYESKIINNVENLLILESLSHYMRLKLYLRNQGQDDFVPLLSSKQAVHHFFGDKEQDMLLLLRFYYSAFPLYDLIEGFCNTARYGSIDQVIKNLHSNFFYKESNWIKGRLYVRLMDYPRAIEILELNKNEISREIENELQQKNFCNAWKVYDLMANFTILIHIYGRLNQFDKQLEYLQKQSEWESQTQRFLKIKKGASSNTGKRIQDNVKHNKAVHCYNQGLAYFHLKEYDNSLGCLDKALQIYQQLNNRLAQAETLSFIGGAIFLKSELAWEGEDCSQVKQLRRQAMGYYIQALQIFNTEKRKSFLWNKSFAFCVYNKNHLNLVCGSYADAIKEFEQAYDLLYKYFGKLHPYTAEALSALANAYWHAKNPHWLTAFQQAKNRYEELVQIEGSNINNLTLCLNNLGNVLIGEGRYSLAIDLLKKGRGLLLKDKNVFDKDVNLLTANLSRALIRNGNKMLREGLVDKAFMCYQQATEASFWEKKFDLKLIISLSYFLAKSAFKNNKDSEVVEFCDVISYFCRKNEVLKKQWYSIKENSELGKFIAKLVENYFSPLSDLEVSYNVSFQNEIHDEIHNEESQGIKRQRK